MTFSLTDFRLRHGVQLPKPYDWRLVPEQLTGEIAGLPSFRGTAIATNGIHVAIERGHDVVIGHLEWFLADKPEAAQRLLSSTITLTSSNRTSVLDMGEVLF